jgi:hypothetical protein
VNQLILDDKTIRKSLIKRLSQQSPAPKALLEELRVHNGNAIADVVTVHSAAHCYEIKGETDSIYRILRQSRYFDLVFERITLVTVARHTDNALRLAPPHWGIMVAKQRSEEISISHVRAASLSPLFDKRLALLTLWKSEMVEVAGDSTIEKPEKLNRSELSDILASMLSKDSVNKSIGEKLKSRNS